MKRIVLLALLCMASPMFASHIAGGEFKITHLSDFRYRIELIIYFDQVNGSPGAKDALASANIFRYSDNQLMMTVSLPLTEENAISYTLPACSSGEIQIRRIVYSTTVSMPPATFNHEQGYYIVWQRCCRNYGITNIFSDNPSFGGTHAGQTFYVHFPPVVKNDIAFINSSPALKIPFADFACPNRKYYMDFSGVDADGDSLVFSLTTPLSTLSANPLPTIVPRPYPEVVWRPPYNSTNITEGNPELRISPSGLLTVTTTRQGLFAFAIKCEEYRNKKKIGETRREYQFLSIAACPADEPPTIVARPLSGSYAEGALSVSLENSLPDNQRCVRVKVSDTDTSKDPFTENVRIAVLPLDFKGDPAALLPVVTAATLTPTSPFAEFDICFPKCAPGTPNKNTFTIGVVAYDNACSLPLTDTVKVNVTLEMKNPCPLSQTITFPEISSKKVGDAPFTLTATATSGLPVNFSSTSANIQISSTNVSIIGPGVASITASQPGNSAFAAANPVERSFCIAPLPPVISYEHDGTDIILSSNAQNTIWYRNGIPIGSGSAIQVENPGASFTAKTVASGCESDESNDLLITATDELALETGLVVFPNPTSNKITVVLEWFGESRFELSDPRGQTILTRTTCEQNFEIDLAELPSGIFFLKVTNYDKQQVKKISKQ